MSKTDTSAIRNFRPGRFYSPRSATQRVDVAVSACLAGEKVRYDGADKLSPLYPLLDAELNLIPICPEFGAGLGVPRPPVQLVETDGQISAIGRNNTLLNVTTALSDFAAASLQQLCSERQLCGYLFKSRSPSCGFDSTPIFNSAGEETRRGSGIQADYFQRHLPHLTYCEETELLTENQTIAFILRCRLTFDFLFASDVPLSQLHQHYVFLREYFDEHIANRVQILSSTNCKPDYLTAFQMGCRQMSEDKLLELFIK